MKKPLAAGENGGKLAAAGPELSRVSLESPTPRAQKRAVPRALLRQHVCEALSQTINAASAQHLARSRGWRALLLDLILIFGSAALLARSE